MIPAATASIAPELELHMGHGFPPTLALLGRRRAPSISIDVVTTVPMTCFRHARASFGHTRGRQQPGIDRQGHRTTPALMATDVLEFATLRGAIACGLGHKTGSLTVGKEADIVLLNTNSLN